MLRKFGTPTIVNAELDRVRLRYHIYETNISGIFHGIFALTTYIDLLWNDVETIKVSAFQEYRKLDRRMYHGGGVGTLVVVHRVIAVSKILSTRPPRCLRNIKCPFRDFQPRLHRLCPPQSHM
jgi:hypothetical protein